MHKHIAFAILEPYMRDLTRSKRIILIAVASVLIIISGILFIVGGSIINSVPKEEPETAKTFDTASPLSQSSFTEATTLEPVTPAPAPTQQTEVAPQVAGASNEGKAAEVQKEKKGGVRAFLSNLVGRN